MESNSITPLLAKLKIPSDYARTEFVNTNPIPELEAWGRTAGDVLQQISGLVKARGGANRDGNRQEGEDGNKDDHEEGGDQPNIDLSLGIQADLLFAVAPFVSVGFLKDMANGEDRRVGDPGAGNEDVQRETKEEETRSEHRDLWITTSAEVAAQGVSTLFLYSIYLYAGI